MCCDVGPSAMCFCDHCCAPTGVCLTDFISCGADTKANGLCAIVMKYLSNERRTGFRMFLHHVSHGHSVIFVQTCVLCVHIEVGVWVLHFVSFGPNVKA